MQGLDDPKLIFQALPVSLAGRVFNLVSNAERVPGDTTLKRLKLGASFVSGEDSPARSLIIAAQANSKRLSCKPSRSTEIALQYRYPAELRAFPFPHPRSFPPAQPPLPSSFPSPPPLLPVPQVPLHTLSTP